MTVIDMITVLGYTLAWFLAGYEFGSHKSQK